MPLWYYTLHSGNVQETVLNSSCLGVGSYSQCNSNLPPSGVMICTVTAAIVIICINACFLTGLWSLWWQKWCLIHSWIYSDSNSQCLSHLTAFVCSCPCHAFWANVLSRVFLQTWMLGQWTLGFCFLSGFICYQHILGTW